MDTNTEETAVEPAAEVTEEQPVMEATEAPAKAAHGAAAGAADPEAKLFVGNLSWGTNDQSLRAAFEQFGEVVSAEVIIERGTGRSKGFGFVQMANAADANTAAEKMNGQMLDGRPLTVNIARQRTERSDRGFDRGFDRGGDRRSFR